MGKKLWRFILLIIVLILVYKGYGLHQNVQQVLTYQNQVREVLAESHSAVDEDLVLAVIYTETKGRSEDVMQSSESIYGTTNAITDSQESIRQGVLVLSENLQMAENLGLDKWSAVQAYNFGQDYLNFLSQNGGQNTLNLATLYSKTVVAPSLGNDSGRTYPYHHPIAVLNGGELYVNGGNIYYSREVQLNHYLIKIMSLF